MRFTSWEFPVGHRIRVSISNAQWPLFWPTPYAMTTSLYLGGDEPSRLLLPTVPTLGSLPSPDFKLLAPVTRFTGNNQPWNIRRTLYDQPKPTIIQEGRDYLPKSKQWPWGFHNGRAFRTFQVTDDHPESASYEGLVDFRVQLPSRTLTWHTEWNVHSDTSNFYYLFRRQLLEADKVIREKEWKETIPRDHQ